MAAYTVAELAEHVSGTVEGDAAREVSGVAPVDRAGPLDVTFVANARYGRYLEGAAPGAVLVPVNLPLSRGESTFIRVANPQAAFGRLLDLFFPREPPKPEIAPTATLGPGARLGEDVSIGPYALLGARVEIGDRTRIGAFSVLEPEVTVGQDCSIDHSCSLLEGTRLGDRVRLHPGARLGTEGFGYATEAESRVKIPQVGGCVIGDDVEIGANSTVDRGALGDTRVGSGTKIDNLVHIGHNVQIGRNCIIVAQVGIAGSVRVGDGVVLAGQVGVADHLRIGDGARIAAQAGVIGDVPAGATYSGYPARPHREALRASAAFFRLPRLLERLRAVERRLGGRRPGE
ncbi:MAG: UDP-3-O-(3-hydroxymyristoyl)glucosamine N-acyltransferase [Gemmatimonadota bacterium]